jgi:NitT/TauT family transport system substrate-binding protein
MDKMKRILLVLGVAILFLNGCSHAEPQEQDTYEPVTLKMNYALVISYAPIILAEAEGYFEDYGITIEKVTFNSSVEAVPLVVSGELDVFAGASTAGMLNVLGQEDNIKVVADRGHIEPGGCTFQAIVVRKDLYDSGEITSGEDLAGHSVSTPPTGPGMYFLSTYLDQIGMTVDEVEVVDIPTSSYVDAFRNKAVDVIVPTELHLSRLMADDNAVILVRSEDVVGYYQTSLLAFGKNLLKDDPDMGVRFLAAYLKGVEKYNEGKTDQNLAILSEATEISIDMLENSCWLSISPDGLIDFDGVEKFQQWSVDQEFMERAITEQEFMDTSFLAKAKALLEEESDQ